MITHEVRAYPGTRVPVIYPSPCCGAMHAADAGPAAIAAGTQEGLVGQMQHCRDVYDLLDYESYSTFGTGIYNFRI
jgi:methylisocitrate lyase